MAQNIISHSFAHWKLVILTFSVNWTWMWPVVTRDVVKVIHKDKDKDSDFERFWKPPNFFFFLFFFRNFWYWVLVRKSCSHFLLQTLHPKISDFEKTPYDIHVPFHWNRMDNIKCCFRALEWVWMNAVHVGRMKACLRFSKKKVYKIISFSVFF